MITLYTDVSRNYAQRAATLQEEIDRILQNENKEEPRVEAVRRDVARMMRGIKDGKVKTKPYKRKTTMG
jgi:IMP dehydrogenase/GMP reductase